MRSVIELLSMMIVHQKFKFMQDQLGPELTTKSVAVTRWIIRQPSAKKLKEKHLQVLVT